MFSFLCAHSFVHQCNSQMFVCVRSRFLSDAASIASLQDRFCPLDEISLALIKEVTMITTVCVFVCSSAIPFTCSEYCIAVRSVLFIKRAGLCLYCEIVTIITDDCAYLLLRFFSVRQKKEKLVFFFFYAAFLPELGKTSFMSRSCNRNYCSCSWSFQSSTDGS